MFFIPQSCCCKIPFDPERQISPSYSLQMQQQQPNSSHFYSLPQILQMQNPASCSIQPQNNNRANELGYYMNSRINSAILKQPEIIYNRALSEVCDNSREYQKMLNYGDGKRQECLKIENKNSQENAMKKSHPKVKFTNEEDEKLLELVEKYGSDNWHLIAQEMESRNVRQCRERFKNYLSPEVINGPWTEEEDQLLDEKYSQYGPKWKLIATFFLHRTDINVKSRWQVHIRRFKKAQRQMISPKKHRKTRARFLQDEQLEPINNGSNCASQDVSSDFNSSTQENSECNEIVADDDDHMEFENSISNEIQNMNEMENESDDFCNTFIDRSLIEQEMCFLYETI